MEVLGEGRFLMSEVGAECKETLLLLLAIGNFPPCVARIDYPTVSNFVISLTKCLQSVGGYRMKYLMLNRVDAEIRSGGLPMGRL